MFFIPVTPQRESHPKFGLWENMAYPGGLAVYVNAFIFQDCHMDSE